MDEFLKSGEWVMTVIVTVGTLLAGVLTTYLSRLTRKESVRDAKTQKELLKTLEGKSEVRKLELLNHLKNDLPNGANFNDILYTINTGSLAIPVKGDNVEQDSDDFEGLISSYHQQALSQSSVQFWFSIAAAVAGFILILYMIITAASTKDLSYVTRSLPGVMVELVAGLFFKQATDTRKRATEYFDKLRTDKQITKGILIANTIEDKYLKSVTKAQIALTLSGIECEKLNLLEILKEKE